MLIIVAHNLFDNEIPVAAHVAIEKSAVIRRLDGAAIVVCELIVPRSMHDMRMMRLFPAEVDVWKSARVGRMRVEV